jgi:hypothetical protein
MTESVQFEPGGDRVSIPPVSLVEPSDSAEANTTWLQRLRNWLWGYDFFISYQWSSGGRYATAPAERLRSSPEPCDVMLDKSEFTVGEDWKLQARVALRHTQRLIVIATRGAVTDSLPVAAEVESFSSRGHRIIPVIFGDDLCGIASDDNRVLKHFSQDTIRISEQVDRLQIGPSDEVVNQIKSTHRILRRRVLRMRILTLIIGVMAIAAILLGWEAMNRRQRYWRNVAVTSALLDQCEQALEADDARRSAEALDDVERRIREGATPALHERFLCRRRDLDMLTELAKIDDRRWTVVEGKLAPNEQINKSYIEIFTRHHVPLGLARPEDFAKWTADSKKVQRG